MYAPCYLPPAAPVSNAVRDAERAMLDAEGPFYVAGRYIADADLAARERRRVAEQAVGDAERRARAVAAGRTPAPRLVTWLREDERAAVNLAAGGSDRLAISHRETLANVRADLARDAADGVLVSLARLAPVDVPTLAAIVRAFPSIPVAGVVASETGAAPIGGALLAGRAGVRFALDVRDRRGWGELRDTFAPRHLPNAFQHACVAGVLAELRQQPDGTVDAGAVLQPGLVRYFDAIFAPDVTTVRDLAARLGVHQTTLTCRFFRAGLPSPRKFLTFARLTWAAWLGEQPGRSLAAIAAQLDASSAHGLSRMLRIYTGYSARAFRRRFTGRAMLDVYRGTLVAPYRDTLRTFDPLTVRDAAAWHACPEPPAVAADERRVA